MQSYPPLLFRTSLVGRVERTRADPRSPFLSFILFHQETSLAGLAVRPLPFLSHPPSFNSLSLSLNSILTNSPLLFSLRSLRQPSESLSPRQDARQPHIPSLPPSTNQSNPQTLDSLYRRRFRIQSRLHPFNRVSRSFPLDHLCRVKNFRTTFIPSSYFPSLSKDKIVISSR